jgi:hypothetical protein
MRRKARAALDPCEVLEGGLAHGQRVVDVARQHGAIRDLEVQHLGVDAGRGGHARVVCFRRAVDVFRGAGAREPQHVALRPSEIL